MAKGRKLGEVYVDIAGRLTKLKASMAKGKKMVVKWSKGLTKLLKRGGIVLGAAIVAAFAMAVKAAITFEKQMAKVATMLTVQTVKAIPKLGRAIKDMAIRFGEATLSITEGLYSILSASISVGKAIGVLRASMMAAKGGFTDTATAANIITTALNSYGIASEKAMDIADKFLMTQKRGKTSLAEFAVPMGKVLGLAAALGVPLEEVNAALSTLTRNGLPTAEALTSIRGAMVAMTGKSAAGVKMAKEFGITLSASTLAAEGLIGMMKKFSPLTADVTGKIITEVEALTAISILTKDLTGLTEDLNAQFNSTGETMRAAATVSATLGEKFSRLWQTIKMFATDFGTIFLPMMKKGVDSLIEKFSGMRDELGAIWFSVEGDFRKFFVILFSIATVKMKQFALDMGSYGALAGDRFSRRFSAKITEGIRKHFQMQSRAMYEFERSGREKTLNKRLAEDKRTIENEVARHKKASDAKILEILKVAGVEEGYEKYLANIARERAEREKQGAQDKAATAKEEMERIKVNEATKKRLAEKYAAEHKQLLKESTEKEREEQRKRLDYIKAMYASMEGYEKEFAKVQRQLWRMQAEDYAKTGLITEEKAYSALAAKRSKGAAAEVAQAGTSGIKEMWSSITRQLLNNAVEKEQLATQKELLNQTKIGNEKTDILIDTVQSQQGGFT